MAMVQYKYGDAEFHGDQDVSGNGSGDHNGDGISAMLATLPTLDSRLIKI